jgi:hypothetical protein
MIDATNHELSWQLYRISDELFKQSEIDAVWVREAARRISPTGTRPDNPYKPNRQRPRSSSKISISKSL